jgi:hypothetical protein
MSRIRVGRPAVVLAMNVAAPRARRAWLAGLVAGAAAGFWFAEWPSLGMALAVAFGVPAAISRARLAALGGLFVGIALVWLPVIGVATARCAAFDAQPGHECVMADVAPWPTVALGVFLLGGVCSLAAARR